MAFENFSGAWTEVDPSTDLTLTTTKVTASDMRRNVDAYVYLDKGVDFFDGDFRQSCVIYTDSAGANNLSGWWTLSNELDDILGIGGGSPADALCLTRQDVSTVPWLRWRIYNGGSPTFNQWTSLATSTIYYVDIERDEAVGTYGTLYCRLYSDATKETLVTTLSVTLPSKDDFRYIFAIHSFNDANGAADTGFSGYIENLNLGADFVTVEPSTSTFNFTEYAPTILNETRIEPATVTFNFTEYVPTILTSAETLIEPPVTVFNFTRYAPTIHTTNIGIPVPLATFNFTEQTPTIDLTGHSVIEPAPTTLNFACTSPTILLTNYEEEVTWQLVDDDGEAITGASPVIRIWRRSDGYLIDWDDLVYKFDSHTDITTIMTEIDDTNKQGFYRKTFIIGGWQDDWYIAATYYNNGDADIPNQNGSIEFLIRNGQIAESYNAANLDVAVSTRASANTQNAIKLQTDFFYQWIVNKFIVEDGQILLYDDDGTTVLKTWTWDDITKTRGAAT